MRASRLLTLVLALQRRGRMTAGELAELLEVSRRTVLRDVDALSEAGVPVVTTQGAGGGIALLPGFRGVLAEVSRDEAAGLLLTGQPMLASALGLAAPAAAARAVLASALPPVAWREATDVERWFLHDVQGADVCGPDPAALQRLARATRHGLGARISLGDEPERDVRPVGLVLAAGRWLLVHEPLEADADPAVLPLDMLRQVAVLGPISGSRPFDLAAFWSAYRDGAERRSSPPGSVTSRRGRDRS